ncbi:MAG: Hsp33 family molecular chaperone HslO [Clostridia bacterium]|nr:Hsp33 family molecular chaperone HslO [Clostridia bacterium]
MYKVVNKLYKALILGGDVSLSVLDTRQLVQDGRDIHKLDDRHAELLGGLLTAGAYMAGCLKSDQGAISITVKSNDGSASASVSGDVNGHIRGYIEGDGLKGGTMNVIKEDGFFRPFNGICELKSDDISENLMQYFQMSEQIDTAVWIRTKVTDGVCEYAGGVVMQIMPGAKEEHMQAAEDLMQQISGEEFTSGEEIIHRYFPDIEEQNLYILFPEYKCNCSRKKIADIIVSLGQEEAGSIIDEYGKISVHCHYCNKDYVFNYNDVERLFSRK